MAVPLHAQGAVLLAWLVFSGGQGAKRRPVLVVRDFGGAVLSPNIVTFREDFFEEARKPRIIGKNSWFPGFFIKLLLVAAPLRCAFALKPALENFFWQPADLSRLGLCQPNCPNRRRTRRAS
jgi:hypothetical protein